MQGKMNIWMEMGGVNVSPCVSLYFGSCWGGSDLGDLHGGSEGSCCMLIVTHSSTPHYWEDPGLGSPKGQHRPKEDTGHWWEYQGHALPLNSKKVVQLLKLWLTFWGSGMKQPVCEKSSCYVAFRAPAVFLFLKKSLSDTSTWANQQSSGDFNFISCLH